MDLRAVGIDRCAGVLMGMATGDALGAGYEFASPPTGPARMIGGGLGNWDVGEWTDDTQMGLCIALEAASGRLDPTAVAGRFLEWYAGGPSDVGIQTSGVLSRTTEAADVAVRAAEWFTANPRGSAGNGSLMRTGPVALTALGEDRRLGELATAISALTHADPLANEACVLWCVAIDRAVREDRLDGVEDGLVLLPAERRPFWAARIDEARTRPPATFSPNGFVVTASKRRWPPSGRRRSLPTNLAGICATRCKRRCTSVTTPTLWQPSPELCSARDGGPRPSRRRGRCSFTVGRACALAT